MIRFSGLDVITELNEITKESNGFKEIRPEIIIPKKSDDDYKVISIRIKGKTLESIENISLKTNRSRNEVINILLESGVSNTEISEE